MYQSGTNSDQTKIFLNNFFAYLTVYALIQHKSLIDSEYKLCLDDITKTKSRYISSRKRY